MNEKGNVILFLNRQNAKFTLPQATAPQLDPDVYETARMHAPGHDGH